MIKEINAKNLNKIYYYYDKTNFKFKKIKKTVTAVKDISMIIKKGEITGLLGINGAGKTTTIRLLSTLIEPTSGSLLINGIDAIKNHKSIKHNINIISGGERNLYWRLSAKENLNYFGRLYGLDKKKLNDRVDSLLQLFELDKYGNLPVEKYSKGMKQRLQIARGLINDPEYIFLDEPTLGLDIAIAQEVREYIKILAKEHNKGILLTTHYLAEAEQLCDFIYVIDEGEIIANGTIADIKWRTNSHESVVEIICSVIISKLFKLESFCAEFPFCTVTESSSSLKIIVKQTVHLPKVLEYLSNAGFNITEIATKEESLENIILKIISNSRSER